LLSLGSVYIFIPGQIVISEAELVESSERIIAQSLNNSLNIHNWWPGKEANASGTDTSLLKLNELTYTFSTSNYNFKTVVIGSGTANYNSTITWMPKSNNVIHVGWIATIKASNNPFKRILQYQDARNIKANMVIVIERLLNFVTDSKNVYGYKFERQIVKDTILATASITSPTYPDTREVYQLINSVQKYVSNENAVQVNAPMLNISRVRSGIYRAIVAIPINKDIKPDKNIVINHMVAGNILVAEIEGGPNRIAEGFKQMKTYLKDFKLTSPAMPFESLVTDRNSEQDTSKWITRIYYPIL
jgi:effector-binding domain-containing protein